MGSKNWSSPSRCYGCIFVASWALLAVGEAPPLWKLWRWVGSQSGLITHCQLCQSIPCEVSLSARTCRWSGWDCALADLHTSVVMKRTFFVHEFVVWLERPVMTWPDSSQYDLVLPRIDFCFLWRKFGVNCLRPWVAARRWSTVWLGNWHIHRRSP